MTSVEKSAFLELLPSLPTKGEFFTEAGIKKAIPYTRVLLALTPEDITENHIFALLSLSRGLIDHRQSRNVGLKYFSSIRHPTIKAFWAAALFDKNLRTPEIVKFLQESIETPDREKVLAEMLGPGFAAFKVKLAACGVQK